MTPLKILVTFQLVSFLFLPASAQEKFVKANGINYHVFTKGIETRKPNVPILLFENGMGMGLNNWNGVISELSKTHPVFAYDRAGVDKSEKVFQMPTPKLVSENLKEILRQLKIDPPYVLVGHSMGGVYIRAFAGFYPNDIAGLVFVDPADFVETKEDWNDIYRAVGVSETRINEMMQDRLYKPATVDSVRFGPWSEGQVLRELRKTDFAELGNLPVPNAPIYFFVGGKFGVPSDKRSKEFDHEKFFHKKNTMNIDRWKKFIHSSSKGGSLIYMSNSGHYIHHDEPALFLEHMKLILQTIARNKL
jgi:pimeloyl-ACP methyl ester carboxylesterase